MWSHDIQSFEQPGSGEAIEDAQPNGISAGASTVTLYEHEIRDSKKDGILPGVSRGPQNGIEVDSKDVQSFLAEQAKILEELHEEDRKEKAAKDMKKSTVSQLVGYDDRRDVEEHIGPVQFNMGGIQVDADDMLKKLKVHSNEPIVEIQLINSFYRIVKQPGALRRGPSPL
jgi:dynein light intermediate chain 1